MTAEIAILNKSAIALAADSAVTISAGSSQEKIYDSADKLFELSSKDAIGVMVNGGMNFMQVPLGVLVKKFRATCGSFDHVEEAASSFLEYLNDFGKNSPAAVKFGEIYSCIFPMLQIVKKRTDDGFYSRFFGEDGIRPEYAGEDGWSKARTDAMAEQIAVMEMYLNRLPDAEFVGEGELVLSDDEKSAIRDVVTSAFDDAPYEPHIDAGCAIAHLVIQKASNLCPSTGLVVAGFGAADLFPTLVSFDLGSVFGGRLKFFREHSIDIERDGDRARVVPFAQKEMVERFLYGLDNGIQRKIAQFCKSAVPSIRERVLTHLDMNPEDKDLLEAPAIEAEDAFFDGLESETFEAIRSESQSEIEDMVEFMPKPELARMAEALVNLTSIKRRVSRGMETVGGPIDVAIISQAEGFVWVKRKHYFPPELNSRYFDRMRPPIEGASQ